MPNTASSSNGGGVESIGEKQPRKRNRGKKNGKKGGGGGANGGGAGGDNNRQKQTETRKNRSKSRDTHSTSSSSTKTAVPPSKPSSKDPSPPTNQKVKLLRRPENSPPLVASVTLMPSLMDLKTTPLSNVTKKSSEANANQRNHYYFSDKPGTAVPADKFQEGAQFTINNFPLERNTNIHVDKYILVISPTTSRCSGLYIKVKAQNGDDLLSTGALLKLDSDEKTVKRACIETIKNFEQGKDINDRYPFSKSSHEYLTWCHIKKLSERLDAFPEAIYYCERCDYHINTISHAKAHLESSTHFDDIRRLEQRETLIKKIPSPNKEHLKAVDKVLKEALDEYQEIRAHGVKSAESILNYLTTSVFSSIPAQNVELRPFGSSTYDVVLPDSDYNIAYTMDLPEGTPIFTMLESVRKKIADDGHPADHCMEMGTPSTIIFSFEGVRVRLCWMSCFMYRSQLHLSELMKTYVDLRPEVVKFLQLIRLWACKAEVDSKNKPRIGLPRYGFDIMAIHFLQQQKYLPVLHELYVKPAGGVEDMDDSRDDVSEKLIPNTPEEAGQRRIRIGSEYEKDIEKIKNEFDLEKPWNTAELFINFFRYYVKKHRDGVIQITQFNPVSRDFHRWSKKILHVVDPFRGDNVLSIPKVSTWQPYYFNCLLTTYLSFAIPRSKDGGPVVDVTLVHTKSMNPRKKIKETPPKRKPDAPSSIATITTVASRQMADITEEEYQKAADELAWEEENRLFLEALSNKLVIDGIKYQARKPGDCDIDDHLEGIYSKRALMRFKRVLKPKLNENIACSLDEHTLLTNKGEKWIKKWKKRTEYASTVDSEAVSSKEEEEKEKETPEVDDEVTVTEITEQLEEKLVFDYRTSIGDAPLTMDVISKEVNASPNFSTQEEVIIEDVTPSESPEKVDAETEVIPSDPEAPSEEVPEVLEAPEASDAPEVPEVQKASEELETLNEDPKTSETLKSPEVAEPPEVVEAPEVPKATESSKSPEAAKTPEVPKPSEAPKARNEDMVTPTKPSATFVKSTPVSASIEKKQICSEEFFIRENIQQAEISSKCKSWKSTDYYFEFNADAFCGNYEMEMKCTHCDGGHCIENCPMMEIPPIKKYVARTADELKDIDNIIDKYYKDNILNSDRMKMMEGKRRELERFMKEHWRQDISLTLFGSVMTGLSVNCSDIDLCLRFGDGDTPPKDYPPRDVILRAEEVLRKSNLAKRVQAIVTAKVPIVKFQIKLSNGETVDADISYYNILAIHNTALLKEYTLWTPDNRFAKLALFIKKWAKSCDIGDASRGSLSSYAHIILLISYLQNCDPPVLPRLQEDFRSDNDEKRIIDNWDTSYAQVEAVLQQSWPKNKETCAQLLIGYFDYYSRFNFRNFVVQCRREMTLSKMEKDWPRPICVEDPFDLNHNLSSGVTKKMFVFIMKVFINSRAVFMSEKPTCPRDSNFLMLYQTQLLRKCHQGSAPTDRQCHNCHRIGHFVESCPQRMLKDARRRYGSNSTNSSYRSADFTNSVKNSDDSGGGSSPGADRLAYHKRTFHTRAFK